MNQTIRPATPGHVLLTQFLEPNGISQTALATHTGWTRKHVNQLCRGKVTVTIDSALILAKVLGTDPDLWLSLQKNVDLWDALHSEDRRGRIEKARPFHQYMAA